MPPLLWQPHLLSAFFSSSISFPLLPPYSIPIVLFSESIGFGVCISTCTTCTRSLLVEFRSLRQFFSLNRYYTLDNASQAMPKEPQSSHAFAASASARQAGASSSSSSVAPYTRDTGALAPAASSSTAASVIARSAAAAAASGATSGPPRLTVNNVSSFRPRVKRLPPDANTKAAVSTQLYQFSERVCFGCVKCRRDNIQSDCVAIDLTNRIMLCTACFTRIIRPRTYTPSRVVPFPSLLSWLNYKPATVMEMSDDVLQRPAEAVAPSGERMAAPMLSGGDRATNLGKLPAIAMKMAAASGGRGGGGGAPRRRGAAGVLTMDDAASQGSGGTNATHPCKRLWGVCQHGETCLFRNAPADLCLAYLMGLCKGHGSPLAGGHAHAGGGGGNYGNGGGNRGRGGARGGPVGRGRGRGGGAGGGRNANHSRHGQSGRGRGGNAGGVMHSGGGNAVHTCRLLHQEVYDLPNTADPAPPVRYEGDLENEDGEWAAWVRRRRESPNSAEWQLWHNGPLEQLFRTYVPARRRPLPPKPKVMETATETVAPAAASADGASVEEEVVGEEEEAVKADGDETHLPEGEDGQQEEGDEEEGVEEGEEEEVEEEGAEEDGQEGEAEGDYEDGDDVPPPPAPMKLSLLDIMSALKGMKKEDPSSAPDDSAQVGNEEAEATREE